ncbi:hypothetical protein [Paenibacillus radicis (ex Gao et al. 2016)]|nr:hypothetical protein [Paenibacillus radicis (ex Gao et al. 2016)]
MKIITSGVDSEYVLANLCEDLRSKGYEVIEIDFGKFKGNVYEYLEEHLGGPIVYITSAHTNLSLRVASHIAPIFTTLYPNYVSPLEMIAYLKPLVSMYIPHDLLTPYGDTNLNEYRFLDVFDYILAPYQAAEVERMIASKGTKVYEAGWIKYVSDYKHYRNTQESSEPIEMMLFVSMVEHLRTKYGVNGFVDYLLPLLRSNVHIKLPVWKDIEIIEVALKEIQGVEVVSAQEDSISLIQRSHIVICNGASSIHAEATLLGKPTICLLDDEGITAEDQKKKLEHLHNLHFYDYRSKQAIPDDLLENIRQKSIRPILKNFDFTLVDMLIKQLTVRS